MGKKKKNKKVSDGTIALSPDLITELKSLPMEPKLTHYQESEVYLSYIHPGHHHENGGVPTAKYIAWSGAASAHALLALVDEQREGRE